jgi:CRISPR-associated protein Cas2
VRRRTGDQGYCSILIIETFPNILYSINMFVSIAVDSGSEARAKELADLLGQYGFQRVQRGLWESASVSPGTLTRLKRDLDRATDGFDKLRLFQFPMEGTLVLSSLRDKKWRRTVARDVEAEKARASAPVAAKMKPGTPPPQVARPQVARPPAARPAAAKPVRRK